MNRRRGGDTRTHTVSTLTRCVPAECLHFSIFFFSSYSASLRRSLVRYSSSLPSQIPSLLALVHPLSSFIRLLPSVPRCCLSPLPRYSVPETSFAASRRSYDDILSERYPHRQMSENYFWRHFWEPLSGLPDPRTAIYLQRHTRLCASLSCRADLGAATRGAKTCDICWRTQIEAKQRSLQSAEIGCFFSWCTHNLKWALSDIDQTAAVLMWQGHLGSMGVKG